MSRYLYGQDGSTIGYMDSNDKYLYSTTGAAIAYWDSNHKYMYLVGNHSGTSILTGATFIRNQTRQSAISTHLTKATVSGGSSQIS